MFGFSKRKQKQNDKKEKVVVLGIDGVPYSLFSRFIQDGVMPNLTGLAKRGTLTDMTASIPEVSSTSWSTFMTGVNPGRHGIYGFTELQKGTYKWRFPNSYDIRSDTLWDIVSRNNKKSIVLNVPSTYPARELNGVLIAGFVALDLKKATYPESAYEYLKSIGYKLDVDTRKARESLDAFAEEIYSAFDIRKKAIFHFFDTSEWDLFIGVITETDRLHHYLWIALTDDVHPQHNFFIDFYKKLDTFIGEFYDRVGDDIPFIMISDHGFTKIKKEIYLNAWLRHAGYLKFTKDNPESLEDMHGESRVFVLDPARFYIHMQGKYPNGSVHENEYDTVRKKLKEELLSLAVEGERVIKTVMFKEELYSGSLYDDAPDIIALPYEGYDLKGSISKTHIAGNGDLTGGHTREDAVFYINREIHRKDVNIIDVGPTIISLMDINGYNFDGKSLL